MIYIDEGRLEKLCKEAAASTRRRKNLNVHIDLADKIHKLFNAMCMDSYVRPHRHTETGKDELFMVVKGSFEVIVFNDEGGITDRYELGEAGPGYLLEIPTGAWHSVIARQDVSVFFEVKQGPYVPLVDKDFANWAPPEGTDQVADFLAWLKLAKKGDKFDG